MFQPRGVTVRKVSRVRNAGRGFFAILVTLALALVGVITVAPPASAGTGSFSLSPIVGVRQSGDDKCATGPFSSTNCEATIVLTGTGLPVADPSIIGVEQDLNSTLVTVNDVTADWSAGHDTDLCFFCATCNVTIGASSSTTMILRVGDEGALCFSSDTIAPGDSVKVTLYTDNTGSTVFDTETGVAGTAPTDTASEPSVSDVNPPYGPVSGGTNDAPGTGSVVVAATNAAAPVAAWFGDVATNNITPVDATHFSVVPPASVPASQGNEGVSVELADPVNGTSPQACDVLLPTGCADEFMYLSEHTDSFTSPPLNLNWTGTLAGQASAASHACGTNGGSGTTSGLTIGGSVSGGPVGVTASYGVSQSALAVPETIIGSGTMTIQNPIVISVSLSGGVSGCEQIPIPDLAIPGVAGFYFVVGGSITASVTLTVTIAAGTYTLSGGFVPGSNADDIRDVTMSSNCVDPDGNPTTDCVTTAFSASLTGTLVVSPLWLQIGPDFANVGAGLTAAATGTISFPPLTVDGDICVAGNWVAQVNVGPLAANTGGSWLGPFNIFGNGALCPMGSTTGDASKAPDAPVNLAATPADSSADLTWAAPASDGGSPITGYNVYEGTSAGGESATPVNDTPLAADATTFHVPGLTNGTQYFFVVKAVNAVGEGAASNEADATPAGPGATAPDAPVDLSATAGDGSAVLGWSAPASDGGSPLTGYNVYEGTSAGGESTTPVNDTPLAADATSFLVPNLTNGTQYFFVVKAVNAVGEGAASNEADATPSGGTTTAPDAPIGLSAAAGDGSATLTWSAPADNGGSAITGYNVYEGTSAGGEAATPVNNAPLAADATSFDVPGLTNGTQYFFVVKAINAVGEGAASNEADATPSGTVATVPSAPGSLAATAGDGSADLSWAAPASDGGSPITGYNVYEGTSAGGESPTPVNDAPLAADATSFTVPGLTNGTQYFFVVKAVNAVGEGLASNEADATPTGPVTTVPDAPVDAAATAGNGSASLSWAPPASDGGSPIAGYNVYVGTTAGGESTVPVNDAPLAADATSFTVPGLTNGTQYFFVIKATNAIGEGSASNEVEATPSGTAATAPDAPTGLAAAAGDGSASLTWTAPASDGGSTITGYNVYIGTSAGGESATPVNASPLPADATSIVVPGLTNGTQYFFVVKAINAIGESAASNEADATPSGTSATVPGAPTNFTAFDCRANVRVTWVAPTADGGSPITGYNIYVGTTPGGETSTPVNTMPLGADVRSFTVRNLAVGTQYYFTVKAINAIGESAASNEGSATRRPSPSAPDAPRKLEADAVPGGVTLIWVAPAYDGGSAITGYNVYAGTMPGGESATPVNAAPLAANATGYAVTGLAKGVRYYFTVRAINEVGAGAPSHERRSKPAPVPVVTSTSWIDDRSRRMF
jgi:predicted phage tail protein